MTVLSASLAIGDATGGARNFHFTFLSSILEARHFRRVNRTASPEQQLCAVSRNRGIAPLHPGPIHGRRCNDARIYARRATSRGALREVLELPQQGACE